MIINSKLREVLQYNSNQVITTYSIQSLCFMIDNNQLTMPDYKETVEWANNYKMDLFNYELFAKTPVTEILALSNNGNDNVPQLSIYSGREIPQSKLSDTISVLDGSQRLLTNYQAYINDQGVKNIALNLETPSFEIVTETTKTENLLPIGVLMNHDLSLLSSWLIDHQEIDDEGQKIILGIRSKLMDCKLVVQVAEGLDRAEQLAYYKMLKNNDLTTK